ncbi:MULTISPECIES: hypothetical protein [unclassified Bradyrhizobium]|uniref:hypothetical protein n=1 Tax=unclassified Bradyrhizobium TaxID=2631580 RepID=UPI0020B44768|nr:MULTISPECIES: hypothetical protein [unclassified Bradyrhizobium]MCP3397014.1 hypothetical protein [Bradyrhizobium sp. CCGB20]MCP3405526.1 hypothetical protein [Bradyrhizobium sp. CCGB01]
MATLVKTTQDGRKLEVLGLAILLGGKLEANELMEVKDHPYRRAILSAVPNATHTAGRVPLTREEAEIVLAAFKETEADMLANPVAIHERFRIAAMMKAREEGIE